MGYDEAVYFAKTWGLVYLVILFVGVLIYAFWPGSKEKFAEAARIPLKED